MTFTNDEILTLTMLEIFEISAFHFVLSSVCVCHFLKMLKQKQHFVVTTAKNAGFQDISIIGALVLLLASWEKTLDKCS